MLGFLLLAVPMIMYGSKVARDMNTVRVNMARKAKERLEELKQMNRDVVNEAFSERLGSLQNARATGVQAFRSDIYGEMLPKFDNYYTETDGLGKVGQEFIDQQFVRQSYADLWRLTNGAYAEYTHPLQPGYFASQSHLPV